MAFLNQHPSPNKSNILSPSLKMELFSSLSTFVTLIFLYLPWCTPYTIPMPDPGVPSALVDAPQTGFSANSNGAQTDPQEQHAVYDIMKATGNSWALDIPDVCRGRWHGIECMPDNDNVYHIVSLSFGALSDDTAFPTCDPTQSIMSPSIAKLPHLKTLFFYRCFVDNPQPIPSFLSQLGPTLETLVLRDNGHLGPIPNELGNLTRLKVLDLHRNNLNGSVPVSLGRLTGLRSLDLSGNKLTGSIPPLFSPVLTILDLNQNHLVGSIPSTISTCLNLMKVDLSRNRLIGPIPNSIAALKDLILFDLSYNLLSGPLPRSLKNLKSLQALMLKGNSMDSTGDTFDGLKGLMILDLSDTNLHGLVPESLSRLPSLRVLHLDGNELNGSIPKGFGEMSKLSELRLNNNKLTGPVPFKRDMIWRMRRKLKLFNNSGLCYEETSISLDSSFDSQIKSCQEPKPAGSAKNVHHLSTSIVEAIPRSSEKSSVGVCEGGGVILGLIQLVTVLFFVCNLR